MTTLGIAGLRTQARSWNARVRQRVWRLAPGDLERVVLRHSRIFILPTRRGLALMATLATMLLTSMNYALSLGFALTFLAGGMVAAGLLATFRNLAGLAASPLGAGEAFAGGDLEFTLSLASGSRQRIGITVVGRQGLPNSVDLPPGATRPVAISIPAPKRGHLGLGRISLSSDFPLGIWRAWAYVHFPLTGTVFPAPEAKAERLLPGRGRRSRSGESERSPRPAICRAGNRTTGLSAPAPDGRASGPGSKGRRVGSRPAEDRRCWADPAVLRP